MFLLLPCLVTAALLCLSCFCSCQLMHLWTHTQICHCCHTRPAKQHIANFICTWLQTLCIFKEVLTQTMIRIFWKLSFPWLKKGSPHPPAPSLQVLSQAWHKITSDCSAIQNMQFQMGNRQHDSPKTAQVSHLIPYPKDAYIVLTDIYITDMLLCASFRHSNTKDMHSEKKKKSV